MITDENGNGIEMDMICSGWDEGSTGNDESGRWKMI